MGSVSRFADYDAIASDYDRRYALHPYDGVRRTLLAFLDESSHPAVLDIGSGTGHWLPLIASRARLVVGMDRSAPMLAVARREIPSARLVRGAAEHLPWRDACFNRIVCINALHHFADRVRFFAAVRRLLTNGGGLMSIGLDPHGGRDEWWVYDWFPETRDIDLARFAPVRIIRGEMAAAGFEWAESFEAERLESQISLRDAFPGGTIPRGFTSQLTVLTHDEFERGTARIRAAAAANDGDLPLAADLRLYATIGWTRETS